ncbi:DUF4391 domain-containing protein [Clostridium oryzae]|uniref:DUF4391 domain-containing protein n=1 Tax=Clostridium oryzae TaxID=1450648 RepID=A0A1V4IRB9_9CLOT|nr:DUF4391 domain-containing protein [Clostridium oryzae]OPJ62562.1 hypothetical protein CLORY_16920 [Clostridium oryzae]
MEYGFYEKMNIPPSCEVGSTIFKKLFYENANMNSSDKKIFTEDVEKITWKYSFKEENLNIKPLITEELDYEEIAVIEISLANDLKYKRIAEIVQMTIPYPLILIFTHKDRILINSAGKRINKADESRNTVENYVYSPWINLSALKGNELQFFEALNIRNFSFVNMYMFYNSFVDRLNVFNASVITGNFEKLSSKNIEEVNSLNKEIQSLSTDIENLRSSLKQEVQFNRRIDINIEIKKLEEERTNLIKKLNE